MMPYEKLLAWKPAHQLALDTYRVTEGSEGAAKLGPREFRRYLDTSLGSASEPSYLLLFAREQGFLSTADWERLDSKRNRVGQLLWRLYRSIQNRTRNLGD